MNEEEIDKAIAQLEERISNLKKKLSIVRSNSMETMMPTTSFVFKPDDQTNQQIQINPKQIEFYDEKWRDVLEKIKENDVIGSFKAFIENFNEQVIMKAELIELPEKADRMYVDALLRNLNYTTKKFLEESLEEDFATIRLELDQFKNNVEIIRQHFDSNVNLLRRDLTKYRKELFDPQTENETTIVIKENHTHHIKAAQIVQNKPVIKKPQVFKSPYKHRTRMHQPSLPQVYVKELKPGINEKRMKDENQDYFYYPSQTLTTPK